MSEKSKAGKGPRENCRGLSVLGRRSRQIAPLEDIQAERYKGGSGIGEKEPSRQRKEQAQKGEAREAW